jgi:cellulose biosynthesis protein BcsQ
VAQPPSALTAAGEVLAPVQPTVLGLAGVSRTYVEQLEPLTEAEPAEGLVLVFAT